MPLSRQLVWQILRDKIHSGSRGMLLLQVLVYFAVAKKGEKPQDGKTDKNPEGLTAAWGPHAEAVASRLHDNGLSCKLPDKNAFKQAMLEKLVWIW